MEAMIRNPIQWSRNSKDAVWTEIVTEKIRKQKELLEYQGKEESKLLDSYLQEIKWNDETNREGHAAKVYFNALFGLDFTRTTDCPTGNKHGRLITLMFQMRIRISQ